MSIARSIGLTSPRWGASLSRAPWWQAYVPQGSTGTPALVLDFENDLYGTDGDKTILSDVLTLSRASQADGLDAQGQTATFEADQPVFDWSTGRRGLLLRPTDGTRAADVATIPLGGWWPATGVRLLAEGIMLNNHGLYDRFFEVHDGSSGTRVSVLLNSGLGQIVFGAYQSGVSQAVLLGGDTGYTVGTTLHLDGKLKANDFAFQMNAGAQLTDTSGTVPAPLTTIQLGAAAGNSNQASVVLYNLIALAV